MLCVSLVNRILLLKWSCLSHIVLAFMAVLSEIYWIHLHWSLFSNHQFTPVSRSQTTLFGMLHLTSGTSFLLGLLFRAPYQSGALSTLLYRRVLILDWLLTFVIMVFSTLVLKPSFSRSLSIHSHLSLAQVHLLKCDHSVFGHWCR